MNFAQKLLAASFVTLMLAGCASTGDVDVNEATGKLVVQYATLKVIEQSDSIDAEDVIARVEAVRSLLDGDEYATLVDIRSYAMQHIDMDSLDAADRLLVLTLLEQVEAQLQEKAGEGALDEDARARLVEVLDWIVAAARLA